MSNPEKSAFVKSLVEEPFKVFKAIDERMAKQGNMTPMPEFELAVRFLQRELADPEVIAYCEGNSFAEANRQMTLNALWHVDLDFQVSPETGGYHQHQPPSEGRFPYLPTLKVIDDAVVFFDNFERSRKSGHDNHYQLDRYRYHGLTLPYLSDWVVVPTNDVLGLLDLIALRAVPVGLTMMASRTEFIDAYFNSPMNAKVHDDNHNRRFRSENQGYFERNNITTHEGKLQAYFEFNEIIQEKVLPSIQITDSMTEEEKTIRKAMTVIYFEWLHEYAKTPDRESLVTELKFQPDGASAFEVIMKPGQTVEELEARRLPNRNLDSGAIFTRGEEGCSVYYFMDRGRNFLTSTYNKIRNGFYDNPEGTYSTNSEFPDRESRTTEVFLEATKRVMAVFDITQAEVGLTDEKIAALLENRANGELLGKNLETYPAHNPDDPLNKAPRVVDDPLKSDAIRQGFILGAKKKTPAPG